MAVSSVAMMLILLFAAYYKINYTDKIDILAEARPDRNCDLHQSSCDLDVYNGVVSLSIEPRPIPLVKPINLKVDVKSIKARAVTIDFQGTTMNMGENRVALKDMGEGQFQGSGMLPVCIRNSMEWQARVMVQTDSGIVVAPYLFVTKK